MSLETLCRVEGEGLGGHTGCGEAQPQSLTCLSHPVADADILGTAASRCHYALLEMHHVELALIAFDFP